MKQLKLFEEERSPKVVNVSSIPQRSPFRYPGGKTWLVPWIRQWLESLPQSPEVLIEPFAGGGIVGLTAAAEGLANKVLLVELDADVASVWQTILHGDAEWLAKRILDFELNHKTIELILNQTSQSTRERGFQTLLRNRINHGGILAPGSGNIKYGENGKGIGSRWYPETLARRIRLIAAMHDKIDIIQGDGLETIEEYKERLEVAFFIDPPYTVAGKRAGSRLYTCFELDHEKLFELASSAKGDVLFTYDNVQEVREMASAFGFRYEAIPMKNTHHTEMTELIIGRDLKWAN